VLGRQGKLSAWAKFFLRALYNWGGGDKAPAVQARSSKMFAL
jgi:hypothetical protein